MGQRQGKDLPKAWKRLVEIAGNEEANSEGKIKASGRTGKRRARTPGRYDRELVDLQRGLVDKPPSRVIGTGRQWAARRWQGPPCTCVGGNAAALKT
ncbi:uncharacterized protein TrAtP1_005521 [Trichoderma atroviride]|uniref:uncharacterized protein n=1 Tax=Hypocrea atroviridis TaxID=63577 RepID=UPI0033205BC7|nr:hypothetical protein TrAtP1_005521 [Trichoderma atroviride]